MKNTDVLELFRSLDQQAQEKVSGGVTSVEFTWQNLSRFSSLLFPVLTFGLPLNDQQKAELKQTLNNWDK